MSSKINRRASMNDIGTESNQLQNDINERFKLHNQAVYLLRQQYKEDEKEEDKQPIQFDKIHSVEEIKTQTNPFILDETKIKFNTSKWANININKKWN